MNLRSSHHRLSPLIGRSSRPVVTDIGPCHTCRDLVQDIRHIFLPATCSEESEELWDHVGLDAAAFANVGTHDYLKKSLTTAMWKRQNPVNLSKQKKRQKRTYLATLSGQRICIADGPISECEKSNPIALRLPEYVFLVHENT